MTGLGREMLIYAEGVTEEHPHYRSPFHDDSFAKGSLLLAISSWRLINYVEVFGPIPAHFRALLNH